MLRTCKRAGFRNRRLFELLDVGGYRMGGRSEYFFVSSLPINRSASGSEARSAGVSAVTAIVGNRMETTFLAL